jgi:hypothetical protein
VQSTIEAAVWSSQDEFCWIKLIQLVCHRCSTNSTCLSSLLLPSFFQRILDSIRTADYIESRAARSEGGCVPLRDCLQRACADFGLSSGSKLLRYLWVPMFLHHRPDLCCQGPQELPSGIGGILRGLWERSNPIYMRIRICFSCIET